MFCALWLTRHPPAVALIWALRRSGLTTAFCSRPLELALCSPQRTHSPAPGLCLWHAWPPWALAWFLSSVSSELQSERVDCLVDWSTPHPVIPQLVWLPQTSWLTLFCSMFPGLPPPTFPLFCSEAAPELICFQQFSFFAGRPFLEHWIMYSGVEQRSEFRACSPFYRGRKLPFYMPILRGILWLYCLPQEQQICDICDISDMFTVED